MRVVLLLWWLHVCCARRVLVVFPAAGGDSLVGALLDAGHEVTYVSPHSAVAARASLTRVDISSIAGDAQADSEDLSLVERVRQAGGAQRVLQEGASRARRALRHPAVAALMGDTEPDYHAVVADWGYSGLLAPLASVFECPLVWYSGADASWLNLQLVEAPSSPAHAAGPGARRAPGPPHTLRDRLDRLRDQTYLAAWHYYLTYFVEAAAYDEIYKTPLQLRGRYPPSYEELVYNASMLLIDSHPLIGQTLALPANAKYIGGHHIHEPTKPLPKNFQQFLDKSKNGVIFINLGQVKSSDLPEYMKRQLLDVFGQLEQTVIWKFDEPMENLPKNVHIVKWAPQASILNRTNTVLFITDGSLMSIIEATYFGVPVIGIPILEEHCLTVDLVAARGRGARVSFTDYFPYKIKDSINEILGNYSYRSNAEKASKIFQNALVSPRKELLHWIELVMEHGAEHLRSPALQLSTLERLHLDVVALILMFLWFLSKVWKVIRVHWNSEVDDKKNQ